MNAIALFFGNPTTKATKDVRFLRIEEVSGRDFLNFDVKLHLDVLVSAAV